MSFTGEQIESLLDMFLGSEDARIWRAQRERDHERWHRWVDPQVIDELNDQQLKEEFLTYFNEGAGRHPFNAIYRDRIVRDLRKFRRTLKFLLNEENDIKERLEQVLSREGDYHIEGMGKALATSFLLDLNPDKYSTWNNKTEMGLEALGLTPAFERTDDWGDRYMKVMQTLNYIRSFRPEFTFLDVDHFLHIVAAEEEGKEAVRRLREGRDLIPKVAQEREMIEEERARMEFAMEQYLEEFIEANFGRIDFGRPLELYQDEEHSGRQYPTSVGNIDLLAREKETGNFIVIELKKGRSSDQAVAQTLRYMGWVQDNLAEAQSTVKGVIIAKEADDRIKYALRVIPNVELYTYNVQFRLERRP